MSFSRISLKIGVWYALAFLTSALALFGLTAWLLIQSLQDKDRDILIERIHEYSSLFARDGISGLRIRASSKEIKHARDFFVRLSSPDRKTIFIHAPDRGTDENALKITDIERYLSSNSISDGWGVIPSSDFGDDVEFVSTTLSTGEVLQVGKDTEDREAFLQTFSEAYFRGFFPILILAIFIGIFLSNRLLKPIRGLTQTVESIRAGNPKARVSLSSSRDELWKLGHLFNQMLEQNERLVQSMRETVDNVAHDLRTPVMRLQNSIEGALRGRSNIDEFREALIDSKENSEMILKLVDGIMDISEAKAGTLHLKKETVESAFLIEGVIDLYSFVAEEKHIVLNKGHFDNFSIEGDRMRLIQVISNLVDNAIKYSPENSTIFIESRVKNGRGSVSVKDQGIGIDQSELPKIWDRLYRVDSSRSSRGLGLGLSLVKAIVEAHGGTALAIPNFQESGTTFSIEFQIT